MKKLILLLAMLVITSLTFAIAGEGGTCSVNPGSGNDDVVIIKPIKK